MVRVLRKYFGAVSRRVGFRRTLFETAPINFYYRSGVSWKSTTIAEEWLAKTSGVPNLGMGFAVTSLTQMCILYTCACRDKATPRSVLRYPVQNGQHHSFHRKGWMRFRASYRLQMELALRGCKAYSDHRCRDRYRTAQSNTHRK